MDLEKRKRFIIQFTYLAIIAGIVILAFRYALPYVVPFLYAWVIATILNHPIGWLSKKLKAPRSAIAIILLLLFYAVIVVLVILLGTRLIGFLTEIFTTLPAFYRTSIEPYLWQAFDYLESTISKMDPTVLASLEEISKSLLTSLGEAVSGLSMRMVSWVSGYVTRVPGIFVRLMFTIISSIFMAIDYHLVTQFVMRQFNEKTKKVLYDIKSYLIGTVLGCLKSYLLIMCITFAELLVGFWIIRIDNAMMIALLIAICDILPVLGTGTVLIPWIIVCLLIGNIPMAIKLAILYVIITIIRNVIEPKIVGQQMGLHPLVTLSSIFIGAQLFGAIGLFGLPITLSLLKYLNDKGTIHLFK